MYKKILLAYDGSACTQGALDQTATLASLCKAELHLIGITNVTAGSTAIAEPYAFDFLSKEKEHIEQALRSASDDLKRRGLNCRTILREGSPAPEIARYAQADGIDLVVIGHSDKGMLARWFEGSVGAQLVRELPCNLLIASSH